VIALTTMISAALLDAGWNPYAAMAWCWCSARVRRRAGLPDPALRSSHRSS
jgi:hypothetical protein